MSVLSINIGRSAEFHGAKFLKKNGYKILEKNYRTRFGEIDIIASKGDTISFVEVKYRKNNDFGAPEEFVDKRKQKKIIKTAVDYVMRKDIDDMNFSFDILSVSPGKGKKLVFKLIENGFEVDDEWF